MQQVACYLGDPFPMQQVAVTLVTLSLCNRWPVTLVTLSLWKQTLACAAFPEASKDPHFNCIEIGSVLKSSLVQIAGPLKGIPFPPIAQITG